LFLSPISVRSAFPSAQAFAAASSAALGGVAPCASLPCRRSYTACGDRLPFSLPSSGEGRGGGKKCLRCCEHFRPPPPLPPPRGGGKQIGATRYQLTSSCLSWSVTSFRPIQNQSSPWRPKSRSTARSSRTVVVVKRKVPFRPPPLRR